MDKWMICDHELYRTILPIATSNMYVIISKEKALLIDPMIDQEILVLLKEKNICRLDIILTHEHFDHISGVNFFRKHFQCTVYGNHFCKENVGRPEISSSAYYMAMFIDRTEEERKQAEALFDINYVCDVDVGFCQQMEMEWENLHFRLVETPGHTKGSICILVNEHYVFSGDSLVDGAKIITKLPGGSKKDYISVTKPFLESLEKDTLIYPGHGNPKLIKDMEF